VSSKGQELGTSQYNAEVLPAVPILLVQSTCCWENNTVGTTNKNFRASGGKIKQKSLLEEKA